MPDVIEEFDRWFKSDECVATEQLKAYCCWLLGSRKQPEPSLTDLADKEKAEG